MSRMFGFASLDWSSDIAGEVKIAAETPKQQAIIERTDSSPLHRWKDRKLRNTRHSPRHSDPSAEPIE